MKPPTEFEAEILDVLLLELRRAMRSRGQLCITIDPYVDGAGAVVFASPNTEGKSYRIETTLPRKRRR